MLLSYPPNPQLFQSHPNPPLIQYVVLNDISFEIYAFILIETMHTKSIRFTLFFRISRFLLYVSKRYQSLPTWATLVRMRWPIRHSVQDTSQGMLGSSLNIFDSSNSGKPNAINPPFGWFWGWSMKLLGLPWFTIWSLWIFWTTQTKNHPSSFVRSNSRFGARYREHAHEASDEEAQEEDGKDLTVAMACHGQEGQFPFVMMSGYQNKLVNIWLLYG